MTRSLLWVVCSSLLLGLFARVQAPSHWLGLVLFLPFFAAVDQATTMRRAALIGWLMSVGYVAAASHWLPGAIHRYTGAPLVACWALLLLGAPLLQPQVLALALVRKDAGRGAPWLAALAGAAAYVGVEWAAPRLLADTLAYGLHPSPWLRQSADLVGARGLTFALLVANAAILEGLRRLGSRKWRAAAAPLATTVAGVALVCAYGAWRVEAHRASAGPTLKVALVQANLTDYAGLANRVGSYEAVRTILDTHYALSAEAKGVDLLVWPETVYPTTFGAAQSEEGAAFDAEIAAFTRAGGVPLVFGAYDRDAADAEYNAAFLLEARAMDRAGVYRKTQLFPLTEWVPEALDSKAFRQSFPWTGTWKRGPGPRTETLLIAGKRTKLAPLICYDALFPGHVAQAARGGAELLVTLSNDAWFARSAGVRLHLFASAFRSIETRLPQARATNSGISALIDATGEIVGATRDDEREVLIGEVRLRGPSSSPFVRLGDWTGPVGLALASLLVGLRTWRARSV